ncbi:hypothetical protein M1M11_30400 [Pseudomonas azerbaijanoccidens]|uniref:hypothetical protein n=1 Tax=Pseudomonas azerbaijanoccidentalis TaxID=2842347 RepID=UPI00200B79A0|nr:hypothetical protein [Pseudomonas azerbaijanoccidentalis]MCK8669194.1 hypothetical protein [Pseudomonas azerbaijanoccidentalis]
MASKVLKSFLIGIGYDTKALEAGDKKINASLNGIKSNTLGISAALVGAFGAGAGVIANTASRIDRLAAATQNMRTPINTVYNFGNAVEAMGGQASEALDALKRFEEFQNNFNMNGQDGSIDSLAKAGIDVSALAATRSGDAMDFARELERQYQGLNEGQRAQVQDALGLSNGVSRLLGEGKTEARMALSSSNTGSIDQMTESARRFAESNAELSQKFEGLANELTDKFLPSLIGASEWTNKFLSEHRGDISKGIDYAADNPGATTALLASSVSSLLGPIITKLGLTSIGSLATKGGVGGVVVTGSAIGSNLFNQGLDKYVPGYRGVSQELDDLLKDVTGLESIPGPLDLMSGRIPGFADRPESAAPPEDSHPGTYTSFPPGAAMHRVDTIYGGRSAVDIMPPQSGVSDDYKEVSPQSSDDLVRAIQRAKVNVNNNLTIQLDGRELDARIIQVNERQNYEAAEDFKPTTER